MSARLTDADLLFYGEEGDWLVAEGHHDLAEFEEVALEYIRGIYDSDYEFPDTPRHRYMRPARASDFPDDPSMWERAKSEEWQMWRDDPEGDAVPITIVDTL